MTDTPSEFDVFADRVTCDDFALPPFPAVFAETCALVATTAGLVAARIDLLVATRTTINAEVKALRSELSKLERMTAIGGEPVLETLL